MTAKFLVRPNDFHIFELDESNNCYRSWGTNVTYSNGEKPNAALNFTFNNLVENYDFFPIEEDELQIYENKHEEYRKFISWKTRPDGHGGSKGGTIEEFLKIQNINN